MLANALAQEALALSRKKLMNRVLICAVLTAVLFAGVSSGLVTSTAYAAPKAACKQQLRLMNLTCRNANTPGKTRLCKIRTAAYNQCVNRFAKRR